MATTPVFALRYPLSSGTVNVSGDIQNLATDVDTTLQSVVNEEIFSSLGGCTLSTTSSTYVDIVNAARSFTKVGSATDSDIFIEVSLSGFATVGVTEFAVGVSINSVDRDITKMIINTANAHTPFPTGYVRVTGLAAGTYNPVKLRAKRNSGTGTLTIDTGDTVSFKIKERAIG
jgi:hypothetical protein